jgi:hypothetical protein
MIAHHQFTKHTKELNNTVMSLKIMHHYKKKLKLFVIKLKRNLKTFVMKKT